MHTRYNLDGIITVLNTPLTSGDEVDLNALQQHARYALQAGVCGFLVPAMAAEVDRLSLDERIRMVEAVLEVVGDAVPVFAGTADPDPVRSEQLLRSYLGLGCTHILCQIPFTDAESFKSRFFDLADLGPEVIMLQDWDAGGYGLDDDLILDLFEKVEAFRCLKIETVPAGVKYTRILQLTDGRLHVSGGWAVTQMIEGLRRGVHAFMPTGMHYVYTEIYQSYRNGNEERARDLFERILPVLAFSNQHLDISIYFFKRLLHAQGIYPTDRVRPPRLPFDAIHAEVADQLIDRVIHLERKIESERQGY